jgi:hypothetical protein
MTLYDGQEREHPLFHLHSGVHRQFIVQFLELNFAELPFFCVLELVE